MNRIVKNYEVRHLLGEGGMGKVYYAVEIQLHREVALKCLRPDLANNPGVMDRFRNEAQAQAKLNHPNVAQLYEYFQVGSEHYMAMEYVNGKTLAHFLSVKTRLPFDGAAACAIQALRGLGHAHKHGIVHRDIKPTNLIFNQDNQVKVTDFGIASVRGTRASTRHGVVIGTYEYISSEGAQGLPTTPVSDLYSMGVVLYEMMAGRLPFYSKDDHELLRMHIEEPRPRLRMKDLPSEVDDIVQRAMDRKPANRYRSAEEMAEALQKLLDREAKPSSTVRIFIDNWLKGLRDSAPTPVANTVERRRTDISRACHRVEDLLEQQLWVDANAALETSLQEHPEEPDLMELRNRLQRQRRQYEQAVGQQSELVGDLLKRGLPLEALKLVENALSIYPRATALLDLKRECRERADTANTVAGELAEIQKRVAELIADGKFKEGEDYVLDLIGHRPNWPELSQSLARVLQARKDAEKRAAIRQYMDDAEKAAASAKWARALDILDTALRRFPADIELEQSRRTLEERCLAEQRRMAAQAIIAEAQAAEQSGALEAACEKLRQGAAGLPTEVRLQEELARVEAALRELRRRQRIQSALATATHLKLSRRWPEALELLDTTSAADGPDASLLELRAVIGAEFRAYQAAVNRILSEARSLIQQKRWEEAVLKLSPAASEMPNEQALADLMVDAQQGLAAKHQAEAIARFRSRAEDFTGKGDFDAAIQTLLDAVAQYPHDAALNAALSQTVSRRDAHIVQQKVAAALASAAEFRAAGDFEKSAEALRQGLLDVPNDQELRAVLDECERDWREWRRREMLRKVSALVEECLSTGKYQAAADRLGLELAAWPGDNELLAFDRRLRAEQRQAAVREALAAALAHGAPLEAQERWAAAAETYERALAHCPDIAAEIRPRIDAARARESEQRRRERWRKLESDFAGFIQSERLDEASATLESARGEFASEPAFRERQEALQREQREAARLAALAVTRSRTEALLARRSLEEAQHELTSAESQLGPDPVIQNLRAALEELALEQRAAIERSLTAIQSDIARGDWNAVVASASACAELYPSEPRFGAFRDQAVRNRDLERRSKETARRVEQIRVLIADNGLDDAEVLLRNALRDNPGAPPLMEVQDELAETRKEQVQRVGFARVAKDAERFIRARDWDAARQLLTPFRAIPATSGSADEWLRTLDGYEEQFRQKIAAIDKQGREMLATGMCDESAKILSDAMLQYPEARQLAPLLEEAREKSRLLRRALLLEDARALFDQKSIAEALATVDRALAEFPGDTSFEDLRKTILVAAQDAAIESLAAQVRALIQADDVSQAERVLLDGLRKYQRSEELNRLRPEVDAARMAAWERRSRESARLRALTNIQQLLNEQSYLAASAAIRLFEQEYGEGAEVYQRAVDLQLQEIARVRAEAADLCKGGRFVAAVELLDRTIRQFPREEDLKEDRKRVQAARAQQERQEVYARGRANFEALMKQGRHEEAIAEMQRLIAAFPEDSALQQDLESAMAAKRLQDRRISDPAGLRQRVETASPRVEPPVVAPLPRAEGQLASISHYAIRIMALVDWLIAEKLGRWRWMVVAGAAVALVIVIYGLFSPSGAKP
jgi:serine/threonine protein kinase